MASIKNFKQTEDGKYICPECGKTLKKFGICYHFWRCHTEEGQKLKTGLNFHKKDGTAWNKGLTKETDERIKKSVETLQRHIADGTVKYVGKPYTEEKKKNLSQIMKKAVLEHKESYSSNNVCGRVKIQEYNGIKFHGKWEVEVAKWLDRNNIRYLRDEIKPFEYVWNNSTHLYFPDFYLPDYNIYIEVKGYETERDHCKWKSVNNLIVFKQKEVEQIKSNVPVTCLIKNFRS